MMEYEVASSRTIGVRVSRTIQIGQTLRINPSEAWLGIESGVIKVISMGTKAELEADRDMDRDILQSMDAEYCAMVDNLEPHTYPEDEQVKIALDNEPWIGYQYTNGDIYCLPLYLFVDHTMMY